MQRNREEADSNEVATIPLWNWVESHGQAFRDRQQRNANVVKRLSDLRREIKSMGEKEAAKYLSKAVEALNKLNE